MSLLNKNIYTKITNIYKVSVQRSVSYLVRSLTIDNFIANSLMIVLVK